MWGICGVAAAAGALHCLQAPGPGRSGRRYFFVSLRRLPAPGLGAAGRTWLSFHGVVKTTAVLTGEESGRLAGQLGAASGTSAGEASGTSAGEASDMCAGAAR